MSYKRAIRYFSLGRVRVRHLSAERFICAGENDIAGDRPCEASAFTLVAVAKGFTVSTCSPLADSNNISALVFAGKVEEDETHRCAFALLGAADGSGGC